MKIAERFQTLKRLIASGDLNANDEFVAKEIANAVNETLSGPDPHGLIPRLDAEDGRDVQKKVDKVTEEPLYFTAALSPLLNLAYQPVPGYVDHPQHRTVVEPCSGPGDESEGCAGARSSVTLSFPANDAPPVGTFEFPEIVITTTIPGYVGAPIGFGDLF